jgi:PAS domain S-box-containing protein
LAAVILALSAVAALVVLGNRMPPVDLGVYATSAAAWLSLIFGVAIAGGSAAVAIGILNGFLIQSLETSRQRANALTDEVLHRKAAEEALRSSEENFRQITENIRDVFWMTDPDKTRMLYISPAYEEIWGRTRKSLYEEPKSFLDAIDPKDRPRVTVAIALQAQGAYDETYRIFRPDGSLRWIRDRAFPVRNKSGKVYRIAGVAEDITEIVEKNNQLRQSQKMEAIGLRPAWRTISTTCWR